MNVGLKPDEFWNMTLINYFRCVVFYHKQEANEWDRRRVQMSYTLNTQVEKKHQKKPREILPLWIDKLRFVKPTKVIVPTKEEKEELLKKVGK